MQPASIHHTGGVTTTGKWIDCGGGRLLDVHNFGIDRN